MQYNWGENTIGSSTFPTGNINNNIGLSTLHSAIIQLDATQGGNQ